MRPPLASDEFDSSDLLDSLRTSFYRRLGGPAYRMIEPELESLLEHEVKEALYAAFRRAEGHYVNKAFKEAQEASGNMLKAVLAGAELQRSNGAKGDGS